MPVFYRDVMYKKAENGEETPENADGEDADWDEEDEADTDSSEGDE